MIVTDEYFAPFGVVPELRLGIIKRWGIIKMKREQSVAEHSYNVAVIVDRLFKILQVEDGVSANDLVAEAVRHDRDEVYTGDVPSPAKKESNKHSHPLVKLADLIESIVFFKNNSDDTPTVERWVLFNLSSAIEEHCRYYSYNYTEVVTFIGRISI